MSANIRIPQQVSAFDTLRELLDLAKNPQAIVEASETARKQMALTEEEKARTDDARSFIAKHADLRKDLEEARALLDSDRKSFEEACQKIRSELDDRENSLNFNMMSYLQNFAAQEEKDKLHAEERKHLDAKHAILDKDRKELLDKISLANDANDKDKSFIASEKTRLANIEAALKAKAAKIRESAADI